MNRAPSPTLSPDFRYYIHENNQNAAPSLTFQPSLIKVSVSTRAAVPALMAQVGNSQNSRLSWE